MTRTSNPPRTAPSLSSWRAHGGSAIGADHRRSGRGNQDAWYVQRSELAVVGVVADGCGSAPHSEVGAWLGARLWADALAGLLDDGLTPTQPQLWDRACARSLERLAAVVEALPGSSTALVHEALLFTLVGFVLTPAQLVVHAIGDGVVWLDGQLTTLGPFPDNQPPYLGYGLHGPTPPVQVIHAVDPAQVERLILATDGAVELSIERFADPRYLLRPHAIQRELAQLNRETQNIDWSAEVVERSHGRLADDTTLLVLGREPGRSA
ncbi:protein phosphatase 2C domain-containing protein [Enhygromyxa salina]|uniref:PPM-type phosphatase domain-containing protein n=1 Tax=Enhygromyxa salina TaxID=215803 RepID=A0A2S9YR45_9BACT|nr:protein phosphatase 2C domain-containing protein [Enhygromyxa salina]PRQ07532.1 hypothetical protein ENSA7_27520 [Enhygromyxa salina]